MKTPSSPRVGLVCRVVRLRGSAEPSHVAGCADCRQFFAAAAALDSALRRDAARAVTAVDDDLERRIMQAVRASAKQPTRGHARAESYRGLWTAGAALVALAFAVVILQRGPRDAEPKVTRADADAIVDTVNSLSDQLVDSVIPSAAALVTDNPLQTEIDSIKADAQSALGFLALNFMPTASGKTALPRSG